MPWILCGPVLSAASGIATSNGGKPNWVTTDRETWQAKRDSRNRQLKWSRHVKTNTRQQSSDMLTGKVWYHKPFHSLMSTTQSEPEKPTTGNPMTRSDRLRSVIPSRCLPHNGSQRPLSTEWKCPPQRCVRMARILYSRKHPVWLMVNRKYGSPTAPEWSVTCDRDPPFSCHCYPATDLCPTDIVYFNIQWNMQWLQIFVIIDMYLSYVYWYMRFVWLSCAYQRTFHFGNPALINHLPLKSFKLREDRNHMYSRWEGLFV